MMGRAILTVFLPTFMLLAAFAGTAKADAGAPVVLWPGGAPGALGSTPEDIPTLASEILHRIAVEMGRPEARLADSALRALGEHAWPGNLRELKNVLERSLLMSDRSDLALD